MARVFFAFPANALVESTAQRLSGALQQAGFEGRPVPVHQLHLTLLFLGDGVHLNQDFLDFVDQAVKNASALFPWPLVRMTRWVGLPDKWRAQAVGIGPERPNPALQAFYERLTFQLNDLGPFPPKLAPHLTLMRPRTVGHWNQLPGVAVTFPLNRLVLYESQLSRAGAVHTPLHMWTGLRP